MLWQSSIRIGVETERRNLGGSNKTSGRIELVMPIGPVMIKIGVGRRRSERRQGPGRSKMNIVFEVRPPRATNGTKRAAAPAMEDGVFVKTQSSTR
jgi:hypothetical protein